MERQATKVTTINGTSKYKLAGNFIAINPTLLLNYINVFQNMQPS